MLGKSVRTGALFLLALSCARNVPQDSASGVDGKIKGAKAITFENGEGKSKGIVTYPGGDRVDWKLVELPAKIRGTLDVKLQWTPPRPGLQLAFDVFDEWNTPIIQSKKEGGKHRHGRVRTATIDGARGKYFIRVYALGRGDAGAYKLTVDFKESTGPIQIDLSKVDIAEPPKLAAIPEAEVPCDEFQFDMKNPACKNVCPKSGAPPGWPPCRNICPDPPDPKNEACWDKICPTPPTKRARACKLSVFPPCDKAAPDPDNPKCDLKADPVTGRVIHVENSGSDVNITIGVGLEQGVQKNWKGRVLRGDSDAPLDGGDVTVIHVGKRDTLGKVHLTTDVISANPKVKLSPP